MRIVVTGAAGFVGRHVVAALRPEHQVTAVVQPGRSVPPALEGCDILVADLLDPGLRFLPDTEAVIHLAAQANPRRADEDKEGTRRANVDATRAAIEATPAGARFVFASTGQVYAPSPTPLTETSPTAPRGWYTQTKLMAEEVVRTHGAERGLTTTIVRIFNLFGPGQDPDYVVASIAAKLAAGGAADVRDRRPIRDFTFAADGARLLALCATRPEAAGQTYNLASGRSRSIGEVADVMARMAGKEVKPAAVAESRDDVVYADPTKAFRELGWHSTTTYDEGLRITLEAAKASPARRGGGARPRVVVFTLTYNERDNIRTLTERVLAQNIPDLILVIADDNSPDGTGDVAAGLARQHPDRVFLAPGTAKRGYGAAYRATVATIRTRWDPDIYVSLDADLSHDPAAIPALLAAIDAGAQVVVGSRYVKGGDIKNWPIQRRAISRGANGLARLLAGNYRVHDNTSGFRAYTRDVVAAMPWATFDDRGYTFLLTFLSYAYRKGFRTAEVPITFTERVHGASKLRTSDVVGFFGNAIRIRVAIARRKWAR